ncbi:DUF6702 family protein [Hymenobacter sp. BT188]|uniref:DUF6702 family protein n=1 Tax=Hymenobacter sp. BT188 TaxID=2763504 RepID=UPI001651478A|nr:DUF6702 family protein [Hymenobacter sp. BT188]
MAHAYHASIMDVQYNPKKQQLEVALKVFTDDFEKGLSAGQSNMVTFDKLSPAQVSSLTTALLQRSVTFGTKPGETLPLRFVGIEKDKDAHWVYFSVKMPPKAATSIYLRHRLLLDTFQDQMNIVNLDSGGKKQSALFRVGNDEQKLTF